MKEELKEKENKKKKISFTWIFILTVILVLSIPSIYQEYNERQVEKQRELEKAKILPNTRRMVTEIEFRASRDNSIVPESENPPTVKECIDFITQQYPDFYNSNEMMEKTIYYGRFIEYFYRPMNLEYYPISEQHKYKLDLEQLTVVLLGQFVSEAVIPVYIQSDVVDSTTTQERLEKVKYMIDAIETDKKNEEEPQTNIKTSEPEVQEKKEKMVWIPTNGGTKYHWNSDCSGMVNPAQVTETEAKNRGFGMCKKCYG